MVGLFSGDRRFLSLAIFFCGDVEPRLSLGKEVLLNSCYGREEVLGEISWRRKSWLGECQDFKGRPSFPWGLRKEADFGFLYYRGRIGMYNEQSTRIEFYCLPSLYPDSGPQVVVICLTAIKVHI